MIRIKKRFVFLVAIICVVFLFSSILFTPLRFLFIKAIQIPAGVIHSVLSQIRFLFNLRLIFFDVEKYNSLKKDYTLLKSKYGEVLRENSRLNKLLEFKNRTENEYIAAKVIFCDASNWSWGILINKGRSSGIKRDKAVITPDGLVGKVVDVWKDASHVLLLNDSDFAASAMLEDTRQQGVVVGSFDGSCRMIYVSDIADVGKGEEVVTSGIKSIFPKGIPIGKIVSVEKDYSGSVYFSIKPNVNLNSLEEVLVIKR